MPYRQQLTDLGRDALALAQTGLPITFTRLGLGDGHAVFENIPEMTGLVHWVMNSGIAEVARTSLAQVTITSKIAVETIPTDFALTEIGVFAKVGTDPEILYAACVADDHPDFLSPTMAGGSTAEHTLTIAVVIGNTQEVTAIFDPDIQMINIGPPSVGAGIYADRIGKTFRFKRVRGVGAVSISESADVVTVDVMFPAGMITQYGGTTPPSGWLLCNGASYNRTEFPTLANVLGSSYGGTGSTFNVPDLRGRMPIGYGPGPGLSNRALGVAGGAESHVLTAHQLAAHDHPVHDGFHNHVVFDPQHVHPITHLHYVNSGYLGPGGGLVALTGSPPNFVSISQTSTGPNRTEHALTGIWLGSSPSNISIGSSGGNGAHPNMPPFLTVNFIIKT